MTSGNNSLAYSIRKGSANDLSAVKALVDKHKRELGFVTRPALLYSLEKGEVFVAEDNKGNVIGLVHYRHRKDHKTTLYNIAVVPTHRGLGIATKLLEELRTEALRKGQTAITLKCPQDLPSNEFYRKCAFHLIAEEKGKKRALNVWSIDCE